MKNHHIHNKTKELPNELVLPITSEVCIRLMDRNDSSSFFQMVESHRSDLRQWLSWVDDVTCVEDIAKRYNHCSTSKAEGKSLRFFVLHHEVIIGMLAAKRIDWELNFAELSYSLDPNFRGRGIITQACKKLISYFESSFGMMHFEIHTAIGNHPSERVAENLGFEFIRIQERAEKLHGDWIDHKIYANGVETRIADDPTL